MVHHKGGIVVFLPPYSPDFNPIELVFRSIKQWLKRNRNYVEQNPKMALYTAAEEITEDDAEFFFDHCGY